MMQGFFKKAQVEQKLAKKRPGCPLCRLFKNCNSPKMGLTGKGKKKILVVAEAPGKAEDDEGTQLIGKAGQLLREVLAEHGVNLDRDCWKINAINCRPAKNRTPTNKEIECCRPMVWKAIEEKKPKVIILLGGVAVQSFLMGRWKKDLGGITKWRGWQIPDREVNAWVCPTYHPSYIMRESTPEAASVIFSKDLENAVHRANVPLPTHSSEIEGVRVIQSDLGAVKYMKKLLARRPALCAFDYETTGLKPHAKGHKIVCVSFATSSKKATAFMLTKKLRKWVKKFLKSDIPKGASNKKFEDAWSREILKTKVRKWKWDTMLAAHVLDNRHGITSIKFQAYIRFGLLDYDSHLKRFLIGTEPKNANSLNRIHKIKEKELLTYCGVDSLLEYKTAKQQMKEIDEPL